MEEPVQKVPCAMCQTPIMPITAQKTGGYCRPCEGKKAIQDLKLAPDKQKQLDEYWEGLRQSGWLDELDQESKTKLHLQLKGVFEYDEEHPGDYLSDGSIIDECIQGSGDYVRVIQEFVKASRGAFDPVAVTDSFDADNEEVTVSFILRGTNYEITVPLNDDWFDPAVADLVNQAISEHGFEQRFIPFRADGDDAVRLFFVTESTWKKALQLGLLPE